MSDSKPDSVLIEAFELLREGEVAHWLEIYAAFPEEMRDEFPDVARSVLNLSVRTSTATLVAPLYGEEADPRLRCRLIQRLASDPCEDSARVLNQWKALAPSRDERSQIRRALDLLARRGVTCPPDSETRLSAWMSSADGMGSYHVMIEIRTAEAPVFLAFAVNVEAGLREAERFGADASEFLARFGDESGLAAAVITPAFAVREVRQAAARCEASGRSLPEGWADTVPWLDKIPAVVELTDATGLLQERSMATRMTTRQLAARREYESWFLPPVAELRRSVDAYLASSSRLRSNESRDRRELLKIISEYVARPRYRSRLVSMLGHQARLYRLKGELVAERAAERSAREIAGSQVDRGFLRVFAERSLECLSEELLRADPLPPDDRRQAWREALRPAGSIDRADVIRLDFAVLLDHVLATELDLVALSERPSEDQLVEAIMGCVELIVFQLRGRARSPRASRKVLTQERARKLASGFARLLHQHTSLRRSSATTIARVLADNALAFANDVCGEYCVHECPARIGHCGQALFQVKGHPARLDAAPVSGDDAREECETAGEQVGRAIQICRGLGLEDPRLDSLDRSLEQLGADADRQRVQTFRADSARTLQAILRQTLESLPRLHPSSDPETRAAWERFTRVYSALPVELVSRMIARCAGPTDVLSLLFTAADPPSDVDEANEVMSAAQVLWNATPRPELDGKTPNQAHDSGRSGR